MEIRKAVLKDAAFIYENLAILRGDVHYTFKRFETFFQEYLVNESSWIYIAKIDDQDVGLVSVNKYPSIRYIGFTYELEEVVIIDEMRGRGVGTMLINAVICSASEDKSIRKIVIKTDDLMVAGRLYSKELQQTNMRTFQKYLNKI